MSTPVVTVASGGLPVVELAAGKFGLPVTEATNGRGIAVTKVIGMPGLPVVFDGTAPTTWNAADKSASITLSGGDTVATGSGVVGGVRAVKGISTGKFYYEATMTTWAAGGTAIGLALAGASLTTQSGGVVCVARTSRLIQINGAGAGASLGGTGTSGDIIGIAVDLTGKLFWARLAPTGNWNNNASNNPATGVGGVNIAAIATGAMFPWFIAGTVAGDKVTMNFGASAFSGAVPSGFTSGWPA
jgi:hypothetical protein